MGPGGGFGAGGQLWGGGAGLRTRCVAEEERRVRANAREYNEKFQYAVSGGAPAAPPRGSGVRGPGLVLPSGWVQGAGAKSCRLALR